MKIVAATTCTNGKAETVIILNMFILESFIKSNEVSDAFISGCPKLGYFGQNCSVPCPDVNCQYCHVETGTCLGCKPGFKGQRCELGNIVSCLVTNSDELQKFPKFANRRIFS